MMNRIDIEQKQILLDSDVYYLDIKDNRKFDIIVKENSQCKLIIIGNSSYEINYKLKINSELIVHSLNKDNSVKINLDLEEKSILKYYHSVTSMVDSNNVFNISHQNDATSYIYNNGINRGKTKLFFEINGIIAKNLSNIVCSQSSKIINFNNGDSKIIPNLIVDSNDIIANHAAYIGNIDDTIRFYLESRGIHENSIKKLIYKATLLGKMELEDETDLFNKIINEWW